MKRYRRIILIAVVVYLLWKLFTGLLPRSNDTDGGLARVVNRPWLERIPKDPRDKVHGLGLMQQPRQRRVGLATYGSMYRTVLDMVGWQAEGKKLTLLFLEKEAKTTFETKIWDCAGEAPKPFNLCLELKSGSKSFRMYSRSDWRRGERLSEVPEWLSDEINFHLQAADTEAAGIDVDCPRCQELEGGDWIDGRGARLPPQPL